MQTQRELLEQHRNQLDERFKRKFPAGRFCLQFMAGYLWGIHWCPGRSTGAWKRRGISVILQKNNTLRQENHQNCNFGACTIYDSFEKLLKGCKKRKCPDNLVQAFVERFNKRNQEGFKI